MENIKNSYIKTIAALEATARLTSTNRERKPVILKNCAQFTNFISKISNTQVNNLKGLDVIILMYNLLEYSSNYSKTSRSLYHFHRDKPSLNNAAIT